MQVEIKSPFFLSSNLFWLICLVGIHFIFISTANAIGFNVAQTDSKVVRIVLAHAEHGVITGSGVFVTQNGYILTNHHVVQFNDDDDVELGRMVLVFQKGIDGSRDVIDGVVIAIDRHTDLALVKINKTGLAHIHLSHSAPLKASTVYALGFPVVADEVAGSMVRDLDHVPLNFIEPTLTQGIISREISSALTRTTQDRSWYQHSAAIHAGNSGGPLINHCGQLVGINTFVHREGAAAMYFASSLTYVAKFLSESGVSFNQADAPCSHATLNQSLTGLPMWFMIVLSLLVLLTLTLAIKKPKVIKERVVERYSQWRRRSDESAPQAPPQPAAVIKSSPKISEGWQLNNPIDNTTFYRFGNLSTGSSWVIGRDPSMSDICFGDRTVSRAHLIISYEHEGFHVEDMNTTNGTRINGRLLKPFKPVAIEQNTRIQLGSVELVLTRAAR
ncbi:trypsin-like peptidase domain-containing protein [Thiomicrospira microaerophila]|uniref:trypsin-like peptidase domain-containing protein n=1 Tax=Thiomicrospira microaerophila TaxID=406020 RepID=UPI0005C98F60|nr:trypsin-like peptidase domain-containing protein [Thiomicrospira microaerophila]